MLYPEFFSKEKVKSPLLLGEKGILIFLAFVGSISFTNAQWQSINAPSSYSINCIAISGANIFVGTGGGGVFLSPDSGTTWAAVNNGLADTKITALAISGTNIFAGTGSSGVFLSTNKGGNWTAVNNGLSNNNVASLAVSAGNILVGTYGGGVFLSADTGANWTNPLPGYNAASLTASGMNIFAGTLGGALFLSTDGGSTWRQIDNNLLPGPNISVAISGTNIFVGTGSYGVYLSADTGLNWKAVNNGLVNTNVTSLAVSGANILAGTNGGGVFVSSDTGANWTAANNGLTDSTIFSLAISGTNIFAGTGSAGVWKSALTEILQYILKYKAECLPTISVSGSTSICQGGSVTLTAKDSTGSGYLWSNGETMQSIDVKISGNYSCAITTACGIVHTSSIAVTVNPLPDATITPGGDSITLCQGSSLTANYENSYLWSNGATTPSITLLTSQIDSVTVTDGYGCSATSSAITVTINPIPSTPVITPGGAATFCQGDSVVLTSSDATGYHWSNGATTQSITAKSADSYAVSVTNIYGCFSASSSSIQVIIHSTPVPPTIQQFNDSLKSSSATGNQWFLNGNIILGAIGQYYVATQNGIYRVEVTNGNGCSSTSAPFNFTFVGIPELTNDNSFSIYPNPVGNQLSLLHPDLIGMKQSLALDIYNVLGEKVYRQSAIKNPQSAIQIDVSALSPGIYFVQIAGEKERWSGKFLKE